MQTDTVILEQPLFQFFTIFNSINSLGPIADGHYEAYALPRIESATKDLSDYERNIPLLTNEDADHQLLFITNIIQPFLSLRQDFEKKNNQESLPIKLAVLKFFIQFDAIEKKLKLAANQKDNVRAVFHHMTRTRKNPAIAKYLK